MTKIEELQRRLSEGRLGRRDFIKQATAMGMAAAIPSLVLLEEARAAAPKHGGKLRQAIRGGSTSDTLFGVLGGGDAHQVNSQRQLLNGLTEISPSLDVVPELAESWEANADATAWTFKLRKGVEFHNGKSLEAADVIHSINVHRGEDSKSTGKGLVAEVVDIKADGKHTVTFELATANADFPFVMSDYHFCIGPDGFGDAEWEQGIGTGPYSLVNWEPGVRTETKRNPNYFKEGKPYFDEVETLNVQDGSARTTALESGAVDYIDTPPLKTLHLLEKREGVNIREVPSNVHYTFPMLMDAPPYDNQDVRTAMKLAMDRDAILKRILGGHGYIGNDHPIGKGYKYHHADLPQRTYDPDKAKWHLKQAGHERLAIKIWAADVYAGGVDSAVLFKEQAARAGIDMEIIQAPQDGYWSEIWTVKPLCVSYWNARPTEDLMLTIAFHSSSAWNETHWKHDRFDSLLVQARGELDVARRREMYYELQEILHYEGGLLAPVFANQVLAASSKLHVPEQIAGHYPNDGNRNHERWWFV